METWKRKETHLERCTRRLQERRKDKRLRTCGCGFVGKTHGGLSIHQNSCDHAPRVLTAQDLFKEGWEASRISLYDEEGIEGWFWDHPSITKEYYSIGDWDEEPTVPDELQGEQR